MDERAVPIAAAAWPQSDLAPVLQVPRAYCSCPFPPPRSLFGFRSFLTSVPVQGPSSPQTLIRVIPHLSPCSGSFPTSSVPVQVLPQSLFGSFLSPCSGPSSVPVRVLPQSLFGSCPCSGPSSDPVRVLPQSLFGFFPASSVSFRSFHPPH